MGLWEKNKPSAGENPFSASRPPGAGLSPFWGAAALLILANLILFRRFLSPSTHWVLSSGEDLSGQFLWWRQFGFEELRKGHLALWNPYLYCGEPFFGGFQSALLYPPNWLFMVLPLPFAVNLSIAFHVFLAGLFTFLWARNRGAGTEPALLVSFAFMWGGAFFLHLVPGHLPNLCTMAWIPLLFLAVDRFGEKRDAFSLGLGMAALALQVFSGHIQYVYYSLLALTLFVLMDLWRVKGRAAFLGGLGLMAGGAFLLSAIQLSAGWDAARESARAGPLTLDYIDIADLTPERLWCLLMPGFFGNWNHYWGGGIFWEGGLATGLTAFAAAVFGFFYSRHPQRWAFGGFILALILLAVGKRAFLFPLAIRFIPLFGHFRGIGKLNVFVSLGWGALAVMGMEEIFHRPRAMEKFKRGLFLSGFLFFLLASAFQVVPPGAAVFRHFGGHAGEMAASLWVGGFTCLALGLTAWAAGKHPFFRYGFLLLGVLELFNFAQANLPFFDFGALENKIQVLRPADGKENADYRVFTGKKNYSLGARALDIWGDDPAVTARYSAFARALGLAEAPAGKWMREGGGAIPPALGLVRLRYAFWDEGDSFKRERACPWEAPRAFLVGRWEVLKPEDILKKTTGPGYKATEEVLLESTPGIERVRGKGKSRLEVRDLSSDQIEVQADLSKPAILVVTDNYSRGWKARPLPPSAQADYRVLPANGFQRAVPLQAGRHHFILEYKPSLYEAGKWVSLVSLGLFLLLCSREFLRLRPARPKGL